MSVQGGPDIIQDGLVLSLDAANPKSYPGSGGTWYDLSGNRNHGTITGNPSILGQFLNFSGSNFATVQYNSSLSFGEANKIGTLEAVGYFPTTSSNGTFMHTTPFIVVNPTAPGYMLCGTANPNYLGYFQASTSTDGAVRGGRNVRSIGRQTAPIYCAMVFNGTTITIYVDQNITTYTWTDSNDISASIDGANTIIGGIPAGTSGRDVCVSLVRQYNRALSRDEIYNNYRALASRFGR